jgi:MFS family permease
MSTSAHVLRYAWFVVAAARPGCCAELPRPADAGDDEGLDGGRHPSIANKADWGLILGCFKWTYAVLSPFGGYVADRFSKRWVITLSLLPGRWSRGGRACALLP